MRWSWRSCSAEESESDCRRGTVRDEAEHSRLCIQLEVKSEDHFESYQDSCTQLVKVRDDLQDPAPPAAEGKRREGALGRYVPCW